MVGARGLHVITSTKTVTARRSMEKLAKPQKQTLEEKIIKKGSKSQGEEWEGRE